MMSRFIAAALAIAGLSALLLVGTGHVGVAGLVAAVVLLLLAANLLASVRGLVAPLRELVGRPVVVTAWGTPISAAAPQLVMSSVSSFGAGLLIRLRDGDRI